MLNSNLRISLMFPDEIRTAWHPWSWITANFSFKSKYF